jgi:hypothetical protein
MKYSTTNAPCSVPVTEAAHTEWITMLCTLFTGLSVRPQFANEHARAAEDTLTFTSVHLSSSNAVWHNYTSCPEMQKCHATCQFIHLSA